MTKKFYLEEEHISKKNISKNSLYILFFQRIFFTKILRFLKKNWQKRVDSSVSRIEPSRVGKNWPGVDSESSRLLTRKHHYYGR